MADYRFHLQEIPAVPEKFTKKPRKPKLMAVVHETNCTGCQACVDFCPVACIDDKGTRTVGNNPIPPVRIRWDECIGCKICAKVCEKLAWTAIDMIPVEDFEAQFGVKVGDKYPGKTDPAVLVAVDEHEEDAAA